MKINIGDLVTLKGLAQIKEKPIGLVKAERRNVVKVVWLNKNMAKRYALKSITEISKLEIVSSA
tara:strand:+ start:1528 stop:1719 length:192 start_codon:yes stop_codon:yes gene_type:complete